MIQNIPSQYNLMPIYNMKGSTEPFFQGLYFTAKADSNAICLNSHGSPDAIDLDYKLNDGEWTTYNIGDVIELNKGDQIAFSGANDHFSKNTNLEDYYQFTMTGTLRAYGNIQSLLNFSTIAPSSCYTCLFSGCTSLRTAPELPATTVQIRSYHGMFNGCSNLIKPPTQLPALSATDTCYQAMFANCTSLTDAPPMSARYAGIESFDHMYFNCSKLSSITVGLKSWYNPNGSQMLIGGFWVSGVAESGVFTKPPELTELYGVSRIPSGWRVVNAVPPTAIISIASIPDISWNFTNAATSSVNLLQYISYNGSSTLNTQIVGTLPRGVIYSNGILSANKNLMRGDYSTTFDLIASASDATTRTASNIGLAITGVSGEIIDLTKPLTFTGKDNSNAIQFNNYYGNPDPVSLQYSKNGGAWTTYNIGDIIELNQNETVAFSGANIDHFSNGEGRDYKFYMTGTIEADGNIMSLMNFGDTCSYWCFGQLFERCSNLTKAPYLPATTMADACYLNLFFGCSSLTAAPKLPATTLADFCYQGTFAGCTSLTSLPQDLLPATTLAYRCYGWMFEDCTGLTTVPSGLLPATSLNGDCYRGFFNRCYNLTNAPYLPATTLAEYCYQNMFYGCTSLTSITVNFTEWGNGTDDWVDGVQTTGGTFTKPSSLSNYNGNSYIPYSWTVVNK